MLLVVRMGTGTVAASAGAVCCCCCCCFAANRVWRSAFDVKRSHREESLFHVRVFYGKSVLSAILRTAIIITDSTAKRDEYCNPDHQHSRRIKSKQLNTRNNDNFHHSRQDRRYSLDASGVHLVCLLLLWPSLFLAPPLVSCTSTKGERGLRPNRCRHGGAHNAGKTYSFRNQGGKTPAGTSRLMGWRRNAQCSQRLLEDPVRIQSAG